MRSAVVQTDTSCDGSSTGSGLSSTAFTSVKIVVLAPMPSASESAATMVNPGLFASSRAPNFRSWKNVDMLPGVTNPSRV